MSSIVGSMVYDTGGGQEQVLIDPETGEVMTPVVQSPPSEVNDDETGEQSQTRIVYQRSKFRVPRSALKVSVFDTAILDTPQKHQLDRCVDLSILMLPLMVILPGWVLVLYVLTEVLVHSWSHSNSRAPPRTPMSLIFSVTCAECVAHKQMQKVGRLQDAWTLKANSRRILNNYASFGKMTSCC